MAGSQVKGQGLPSGTMLARGFHDAASIQWPLVAARDIFELKYGKALVEADRCPGNIPVYGTNGRCGYHDTSLFHGPGVILGRKGQGPLGVEWCEVDYWVIDTAYSLALRRSDVDLKYAYFLIKFVGLNHLKDGTSNPSLSRDTFGAQALPLPPLPIQHAIAHILGKLDDKIELNRRMNETLEAMARALFQSWFVDFDPVHSKIEGRWHRGESLPGLPAYLWDLFPNRLVDSELGETPEGWEVGTLRDFSSLNPEAWSKETRPAVINYVDLSNTKWGRIEAVTAYAQQDAPSRAQRVLRPQDTIIGTVRPGNGSYAFIQEDGLTGSTGFAVLRPLRIDYAEFVYFAATAAENIEVLSHLADGGAYPAVRPEVVAATQVIRHSLDLLVKFSRVTRPLLAKMAGNCSTPS
jgi:restriction endonuclease S subunit